LNILSTYFRCDVQLQESALIVKVFPDILEARTYRIDGVNGADGINLMKSCYPSGMVPIESAKDIFVLVQYEDTYIVIASSLSHKAAAADINRYSREGFKMPYLVFPACKRDQL